MNEYLKFLSELIISSVAIVIQNYRNFTHQTGKETYRDTNFEHNDQQTVWVANILAPSNIHFYALPCDIISLTGLKITQISQQLLKLVYQLLVLAFRYFELQITYEQIPNRIRIKIFSELVIPYSNSFTTKHLQIKTCG